jgi:hypothetical protein
VSDNRGGQVMSGNAQPGAARYVLLASAALMMWGATACTSDSASSPTTESSATSSTLAAESESSGLTAEQQAALAAVASAFDNAEQVVVDAFESETVVPKLERWQESEILHQQALTELRDALPAGDCRIAIDLLLLVEEDQNAIRLQLIENYRSEEFGLVANSTVEYGASVVNGALQAEEEVAVACGRSTVDPSRLQAGADSLTPDQTELFGAVLMAYAATGEAFDEVFSIAEFVADLEALQDADALVANELGEVLALLGDGRCRTALSELLALEKQQADLRAAMITAGQDGEIVTMFRLLGEYTEVNSPSDSFRMARQSAVDDCGFDV